MNDISEQNERSNRFKNIVTYLKRSNKIINDENDLRQLLIEIRSFEWLNDGVNKQCEIILSH